MMLFRGEPCEVIEQRLARSVKGNRFELLVIRTPQWPRICVLPREVEETAS